MLRLGVNIDHVATLRQARRVAYPDPLQAALAAQRAGADAITLHVREDRRHVNDDDLRRIRERLTIHVNQELAPIPEMVELALRIRPHEVCLVPERRQELTTEGGLDVVRMLSSLGTVVSELRAAGIVVSLFIDPDPQQVGAARELGADYVELHTGTYSTLADADFLAGGALRQTMSEPTRAEFQRIRTALAAARAFKLKPNAGHGLNYHNVGPIAALGSLRWLHIGHSIVARAVMVGMSRAVREMKALMLEARR